MEGGIAHGKETIDVLWGAPVPVYKGGDGRRSALVGAPWGGKPTRTPSPSRPLPSFEGGKWKEREREKERGDTPLPLSNSDCPWGAHATPCGLPSLSPYGPCGPLLSPGGSGNPSVLRKIPEPL